MNKLALLALSKKLGGGSGANKLAQVIDGSITEITEEDLQGVTHIKNNVFSYSNLQSIVIPSSVKSIGAGAFDECTSLKNIRVKGDPPTIELGLFDFVNKDFIIKVDANNGNMFKNAENWSRYADKIREEGSGGETGNGWLFENEYIDGARDDLPAPSNGVSYTLFVDGEEIATSVASDDWIDFSSSDYRIWFRYQGYWHFHPIDSQVQSGSVSIRINDNIT